MKNPNEIVAVKCEGCFTEWYSPFFKEPYEDHEEYRKYYEENILEVQPVIGPSLGDSEEEFISDDLQCLAERMVVDVGLDGWDDAVAWFKEQIAQALEFGNKITAEYPKCGKFTFTPYRRCEMPKPNEEHLKVYGPFADLMRERVAAI